MRFSLSLIFAAAGAYAFPQDVQPISQISDGQIQAPPATSPLYTATVTGSTFIVSPSGSEEIPTGTATVTASEFIPTYTATVTGSSVIVVPSGGNTTVVIPTAPSGSGSPSSTSPGASRTPSGTGAPAQSPSSSSRPSAAIANAVSFSGLVLAVLGAVLV